MATIKIGMVGDSLGAGTNGDPASAMSAFLTGLGNTVTVSNACYPGTTTADWLPTGSRYLAAMSAFAAANVTVVHLMLGTNDGKTVNGPVSSTTYAANYAAITGDLTGRGYTVVLSKPPFITASNTGEWGSTAGSVVVPGYWTAGALPQVNGATVFRGDEVVAAFSAAQPATFLNADGVHAKDGVQNVLMGEAWGQAIAAALRLAPAVTLRGGATVSNPGYRAAPDAVSSLTSPSQTSGSVTLTWTESGAATTTRMVTYRPAGSGSYAAVPGGTFGFTGGAVTGLSASTAYDVRVVAGNPFGSAAAATLTNVSTSAAAVAPGQVGVITAGTATASTIQVTYTAPGSGTAPITYAGFTAPHGGSTWTANGGSFTSNGGTFTGLAAGTNYDLRIVATNAAGSSTRDNTAGATTASGGRTLPTVAAASPSLWFDASNAAKVFSDTGGTTAQGADGGTVKALQDALSGGTVLATQPTTGNAPTLALAKTNGRAMLRFAAASSQVLRTPSGTTLANAIKRGSAFTARLVWITTTNASPQGVAYVGPAGSTLYNPGTCAYMDSGGGGNAIAVDGSAVRTAYPAVGQVNHFVIRYDGTTAYMRATVGGTDASQTYSGSQATAFDQVVLGVLPQLNWYLDGWLGEVALWPGFATSAEADALLSDVAAWWGN